MYLKDIALFSNLNKENLEAIDKISTLVELKSGDILFYEGEMPYFLHVLLNGVVKLYKTDSKGRQKYIHQFTPISLIGELANFENVTFPATAEAVTKVEVLKIDYKRLHVDFFTNPNISFSIIKSLSQKIKILSNFIHQEMILSTEAKIVKLIIEHSEIFEKLKNTDIAAITNTTPETLSRILTKLKKLNYIKFNDKHELEILDKESLTKMFI